MVTKANRGKLPSSYAEWSEKIEELKTQKDMVKPHFRQGDEPYITILEMFKVGTSFYAEVESRLFRALPHLDPGIEYAIDELNIGEPFSTPDFSTAPWVVVCLKDIAARTDAVIKEVQWGKFRIATAEVTSAVTA